MSTFFQQTAQAMIAKHIDRFPLLKLDQVIDWQPIEQYLNRQRTRYLRDHRGRPAYSLLSMFKAVLLGQWHSLSDPELEHSLITRIDFNLFCRFDELSPPFSYCGKPGLKSVPFLPAERANALPKFV